MHLRLGTVIFDDGILEPFIFSAIMLKRYSAMVETFKLVWVMFEGWVEMIPNDGHGKKFPSLSLISHPIIVYDVTGLKLPIGSSHVNMMDIVSADNTVREAEKLITGSGTAASVLIKQSLINKQYNYIPECEGECA